MFEDFDLMNVWNILEIRKDLDKGYGYVGHDIRNMIAATSWIFLRQEGKKFFNKHQKYNIFYSRSIESIIYVPAFMCIDFHRCEGTQLNKHIPNYNHSSTQYQILNEKAFDYDYQEKINKIPAHRILAINRGEKLWVLKVNISDPLEENLSYLERKIIKNNSPFVEILKDTIQDSYSHFQ